jgi:hypothetical protein
VWLCAFCWSFSRSKAQYTCKVLESKTVVDFAMHLINCMPRLPLSEDVLQVRKPTVSSESLPWPSHSLGMDTIAATQIAAKISEAVVGAYQPETTMATMAARKARKRRNPGSAPTPDVPQPRRALTVAELRDELSLLDRGVLSGAAVSRAAAFEQFLNNGTAQSTYKRAQFNLIITNEHNARRSKLLSVVRKCREPLMGLPRVIGFTARVGWTSIKDGTLVVYADPLKQGIIQPAGSGTAEHGGATSASARTVAGHAATVAGQRAQRLLDDMHLGRVSREDEGGTGMPGLPGMIPGIVPAGARITHLESIGVVPDGQEEPDDDVDCDDLHLGSSWHLDGSEAFNILFPVVQVRPCSWAAC